MSYTNEMQQQLDDAGRNRAFNKAAHGRLHIVWCLPDPFRSHCPHSKWGVSMVDQRVYYTHPEGHPQDVRDATPEELALARTKLENDS